MQGWGAIATFLYAGASSTVFIPADTEIVVTATFMLKITAPYEIVTAELPGGVVGEDYSFTMKISGSEAGEWYGENLAGLVINQQTGSALTEGPQHLDGFQALTYSRIRSLDRDGDFSRTNRQRKVISALVDSVKGISLTEMTPLIGKILPMISTDLNRG